MNNSDEPEPDEPEPEPVGGQRQPADGCGVTVLPQVGEHPGFVLWRVSLVLVVAMFVLALADVRDLAAWTVLTVAVSWCVTWAHPWTAAAAAVETWLVETGFGVHRFGTLTFSSSDLLHLAAVLGAVVTVAVVSRRLARPGPVGAHLLTETVDS